MEGYSEKGFESLGPEHAGGWKVCRDRVNWSDVIFRGQCVSMNLNQDMKLSGEITK